MVQASESSPKQTGHGPFQKVAERLYRHQSSGVHNALVKRAGKQYRRSLKTADRKLAERSLAEFRQKVGRLDPTKARSNPAFADMSRHWLSSVIPQLKASSAQRRETRASQLLPFLGAMPIRSLTAAVRERWAAKRSPGIAASTCNNERDTIMAILRYAKREGLLLDNPAEALRRRKLGKSNILIPSKEEFQRLVAKLRELDLQARKTANLVEVLGIQECAWPKPPHAPQSRYSAARTAYLTASSA